jgi:hypothetical protein
MATCKAFVSLVLVHYILKIAVSFQLVGKIAVIFKFIGGGMSF